MNTKNLITKWDDDLSEMIMGKLEDFIEQYNKVNIYNNKTKFPMQKIILKVPYSKVYFNRRKFENNLNENQGNLFVKNDNNVKFVLLSTSDNVEFVNFFEKIEHEIFSKIKDNSRILKNKLHSIKDDELKDYELEMGNKKKTTKEKAKKKEKDKGKETKSNYDLESFDLLDKIESAKFSMIKSENIKDHYLFSFGYIGNNYKFKKKTCVVDHDDWLQDSFTQNDLCIGDYVELYVELSEVWICANKKNLGFNWNILKLELKGQLDPMMNIFGKIKIPDKLNTVNNLKNEPKKITATNRSENVNKEKQPPPPPLLIKEKNDDVIVSNYVPSLQDLISQKDKLKKYQPSYNI